MLSHSNIVPICTQALVLGRNNVDFALEWLLGHAEEPDAAEPPTQQQLRQVCVHVCGVLVYDRCWCVFKT